MSNIKEIIYNKLPLQVLSYLSKQSLNSPIYGSKLANILNLSQSGTSTFLKQLSEMKLLESHNVGRTLIYNVDDKNPLLKHFRIFDNLLEINQLINGIKQSCRKIILFGSCSRGEDTHISDIDLFIIADRDNHDIIRKAISDCQFDREIKPIIIDTLELVEMEHNDKVFLDEVNKGIVLL